MIIDDKKDPLKGQTVPVTPVSQSTTVNTVQSAPVQTVSKAADVENLDPNDMKLLIRAMIQREARAAKIDEDEFKRKEARRLQYESNRTDDEKTTLQRQAACQHLKGGKTRRRNAAVDHDVYMFTFVTGETYIKCHTCKMKWRPTDTKQYVARNGKVYPNHTKIGWAEASDLAATSTNTSARSEIPPSQFANVAKEVAMPNPSSVDIDMEPVGDADAVTV